MESLFGYQPAQFTTLAQQFLCNYKICLEFQFEDRLKEDNSQQGSLLNQPETQDAIFV